MESVQWKSLFFHVVSSSNTERNFERVLKIFWLFSVIGRFEFQEFRGFFLRSIKRIVGTIEGVYCFSLNKIGKFVHVNPDTGGFHVIVGGNILKTFSPELLSIRWIEIWEVNESRPDTTDQRVTVMLVRFNIDVELLASSTRGIRDSDSCINNGNPSDSEFISFIIGKLLQISWLKFDGVDGEIIIFWHVVDVGPEDVEREIIFIVVIPNIEQFSWWFVSVSALMETLRPEWVQTVTIHVSVIHFDSCLGLVITQEVFEFDNTARESEGKSFIFDEFG